VGVTPLGVVLNRAQVDPDYYYYGYYSEDASSPSGEGELGAPFGTGQAKAAG
jgi:hypothetical protein